MTDLEAKEGDSALVITMRADLKGKFNQRGQSYDSLLARTGKVIKVKDGEVLLKFKGWSETFIWPRNHVFIRAL